MMSNHTDMQDKNCGHCYDTHPIQSQYTKVASFVLVLNRMNVVAMTTILVLHVGVIRRHVPCHYHFMPPVISDLLQKVSKNGNQFPIYVTPNSPKVNRNPRSTFDQGVVMP